MNVASILRTKGAGVATATPGALVPEIAQQMTDRRIGALVVAEGKGPVLGIVSERDIVNGFVQRGRDLSAATASDLMTPDVLTCTPADTIASLMATMTERRIRHLPVLDEGRLCGIVSIGDVVKNRLDEIEAETEALREYVTTA